MTNHDSTTAQDKRILFAECNNQKANKDERKKGRAKKKNIKLLQTLQHDIIVPAIVHCSFPPPRPTQTLHPN
jgi:hypothetical protein